MTQDRDTGSPQEFSPQDQERREAIIIALGQSLEAGLELVEGLDLPDADKNLYYKGFINGVTSSRFAIRATDKEYEMDQPPQFSWVRPCGIEVPTFSRGLSVSLLKHRRYDHNLTDEIQDEDIVDDIDQAETEVKITREMADDIKSKAVHEGAQALFHFRDAFLGESQNVPQSVANTLFATYMAQGMADEKFSVTKGNPGTEEFKAHLIEGLKLVRRFVSALDDESFSKLNQQLRGFKQMEDATLEEYAEQFLLTRVGVVKSPGIIDDWSMERRKRQLGPKEAIEAGKSYLNCDFRDLPLNEGASEQAQPPQLPWREYTTNMWNNDHQLFGRYEQEDIGMTLQVDYMLDSTHFPAKYVFFSNIEITLKTPNEETRRILLGQEVGGPELVYPIIIAGDFDFQAPELRNKLEAFASDSNVKPDVGRVVEDILRISSQGELVRLNS